MNNTHKRIVYLFFIVLISLSTVEALLRTDIIVPTFIHYDQELFLSRTLLYETKPYCTPEINSLGFRDRDFTAKKDNVKRVLYFGDSFVEGLAVKPDQTAPKQLESMLGEGYEVFNMGKCGYGPDQSLIRLMNEGLGFDPDMVVLSIYATNDFNDIYKNRLFTLDPEGRLATSPENAVTANMPFLRLTYVFEYIVYKYKREFFSDRFRSIFDTLFNDTTDFELITDFDSNKSKYKYALMSEILMEFKTTLSERGIDFLVVIVPSYDYIFTLRELQKDNAFLHDNMAAVLCSSRSIPHIKLFPKMLKSPKPLDLYDRVDRHLSARGHELVASEIHRYITENNRL